jgi:DNA repair protein RAD50
LIRETIIEVLKYITTGALPPSCDKGKNFVMEPKLLSQAELIADARLKFRAFNGRPVLARRKALLTQSNKGAKFESIEQTLKTKDEKGEMFEINHQCAEIEKQIPQLLGISKPILENIVFCHQDESLWPFSDSANLKAIFDEMFETKKYTRIIDAFWEQHKDYAKYAKENRKALEYLRRLYDEDNRSKRTAIRNMEKVTQDSVAIAQLRKQLEAMAQDLTGSKDEANRKFELVRKRATVEERIKVGSKATQAAAERVQTLQREFA